MIRHHSFQARRGAQRGFTLIELMVSLVLFALVVTGMMAVAVSMISGYRDQEITISTESASRSTIDFMTNALHNASTGVPTFDQLINLDVAACTTGAIQIATNVANPAPLVNTSDQITITFASGAVFTTTTATYSASTTPLGVIDATQIAAGDYVIVTNFDKGHFVKVTASSGTAPGTITLASPACLTPNLPTGDYIAGATVIRAMRATFAIGVVPSNDLIGSVPVLTMDADGEGTTMLPEPIAEGIEDLQVVYGADNVTVNGILDTESTTANADEWYGNVNAETVPVPLPNSTRAIRLTIVARTVRQFSGVNTFKLQAVEDRPANAATDNFRRRVLSTIVEIRNLQGSP